MDANKTVEICGHKIDVFSLNTLIVGSGAAGLNAADWLHTFGVTDIAILAEGINMGTSRNAGSDKQTYYKIASGSSAPDSAAAMAKTLFEGGAMHGDIALIEAASSARSFYKLVNIGVPFPHNRYGEYVGYRTDNEKADDPMRATSAGPLTSKYMTEKLEEQARAKGIRIFDRYLVIGVLTDRAGEKVAGIMALDLQPERGRSSAAASNTAEGGGSADRVIPKDAPSDARENVRYALFNCVNVVYAAGGPASIYSASVYPESQTGASGVAFEAGVRGINLTESQYGIASVKFRWNLSGTYQQVIPRYISTDIHGGDEKEFLRDYFDTTANMIRAIFLKGYHWPFDPAKADSYGPSLIDLLVYNETRIKGRRVFLDYTGNPEGAAGNDGVLNMEILGQEAGSYLKKCGAIGGTPFQRLAKINMPAVRLFREHGIDLGKEPLEADICAQHNNGGLMAGIWWESNLKHFFPVGEICGTFGVKRPGGSALNSTQTGSLRAAQYISSHYRGDPVDADEFIGIVSDELSEKIKAAKMFAAGVLAAIPAEKYLRDCLLKDRKRFQERMSRTGAHIRVPEEVDAALKECLKDLEHYDGLMGKENCGSFKKSGDDPSPDSNDIKGNNVMTAAKTGKWVSDYYKNRDILLTQYAYLCAIKEYIRKGGGSRGSYMIHDTEGSLPASHIRLPDIFRSRKKSEALNGMVCETEILKDTGESGKYKHMKYKCVSDWKAVRPLPEGGGWFETVWDEYIKDGYASQNSANQN
ncbi:MAG: FAD-binding protein [Eubacteriales bacterium]|nr:FAD-binding protein [Eubacteriales bacterium]